MLGRRSKYGNRRITAGEYTFDSIAEYNRYLHLTALHTMGHISALRVHPRYLIVDGYRDPEGKRVRPTYYEGDFEYVRDGHTIVEDVKGGRATQTRLFQLKAKLFRQRYGQTHTLVIVES